MRYYLHDLNCDLLRRVENQCSIRHGFGIVLWLITMRMEVLDGMIDFIKSIINIPLRHNAFYSPKKYHI